VIIIAKNKAKVVKVRWFGNRRYYHIDYAKTEKKAERLVRKYENRGSKVEIVKSRRYYEIYASGGKQPKHVIVYTSKAHRRKKHERKPSKIRTSKAFRIRRHKRKGRSTLEEIKRRGGTIKEIRAKKKTKPK